MARRGVVLVLFACGASPSSVMAEGLRLAGVGDPRAWEVCSRLEMGQGRGSCRVAAARTMPEDRRVVACSQIVQDYWRDECWFELAEDRAKSGAWSNAADACANAGDYRVDCARHLYQGRGGGTAEVRSELLESVPEAEPALELGAAQVAGTRSAVEGASAARVAAGRADTEGAPWESVAYDVAASCPPGAAPGCADELAQRLSGRWRRASERQPAVRAALCDGGMPPAGFSWAPHPTLDAAVEQVRKDVCSGSAQSPTR